MPLIDSIRTAIRRLMHIVAVFLDKISDHRLTPNMVTLISMLMHVMVAWFIATQLFVWAALLLVIFGLFDALDGELARLQQRASPQGMLLDASVDRFKETLLYLGAGYALSLGADPRLSVLAVAACGASICVSYVKAKGEAAVAASGKALPHAELNRLFADGFARFEIRMFLLVVGLVTQLLAPALALIALLAAYTALQRLYRIYRKLARD